MSVIDPRALVHFPFLYRWIRSHESLRFYFSNFWMVNNNESLKKILSFDPWMENNTLISNATPWGVINWVSHPTNQHDPSHEATNQPSRKKINIRRRTLPPRIRKEKKAIPLSYPEHHQAPCKTVCTSSYANSFLAHLCSGCLTIWQIAGGARPRDT